MSEIEVSAWGRRGRRSFSDPEPRKPQAFSNAEYYKLWQVCDQLAYTQMSHMYDDFTADELRQLFIPESYRDSFTQVYRLEENMKKRGTVYVDLMRILPHQTCVFGNASMATCIPSKLILRAHWNYDTLPDGFITTEPTCGEHNDPCHHLNGRPPDELRDKFVGMAEQMVRVGGEWATVKWVLQTLQNKLHTPQQMRYVWPAIYTLATAAKLDIAESLSQASSRAGTNAAVPKEVLPYIKPSYEVVSRSVLLGADGDQAKRYRDGQIRLVSLDYELNDGASNFTFSGP